MSTETEMFAATQTQVTERPQQGGAGVLFVEDDENDYITARYELYHQKINSPVHRVVTADELFDYLSGEGRFENRDKYPMPALIVMDLRLPGADGLEAQAKVRAKLKWRGIPIILISSSEHANALRAGVKLGAQAYMVKPFDGETFRCMVEELKLPLQFR